MVAAFFALIPLLSYVLVELREIISIASLLVCACIASSDRFFKILFVVTIMFGSMIIGEALSVAFFPEIAQSADWPQVMSPATQIRFMLTYLLLQALLLFFTAMLLNRKTTRFSAKEWLLFAFFPISQILLLNIGVPSGFKQDDRFMQIWLVVAALVGVGVDIGLYFTIRGMSQRAELKAQTAMLSQQVEAQKKHYAALTKQYEQMRHARHDIANHMHTIQILLNDGDAESAQTSASELVSRNTFSSGLGECENPIVDAFLYSRISDLREKGISIETTVQLPANISISDIDLISIFGNLLDNAEEACLMLPEGRRSIYLHAALKDSHLAIRMENSIQPQPLQKSSLPEARPNRGLGTYILTNIAARYHGYFQGKAENDLYISLLTLRLEESI